MNEEKLFDFLRKKLKLKEKEIEDSVNLMGLLEHHFFSEDSKEDYRLRAINFCIENKIDFRSTVNNTHELIQRFIKMECPLCKKDMRVVHGGGGSVVYGVTFRCDKCKTEGTITVIQDDGISFSFKEKE